MMIVMQFDNLTKLVPEAYKHSWIEKMQTGQSYFLHNHKKQFLITCRELVDK